MTTDRYKRMADKAQVVRDLEYEEFLQRRYQSQRNTAKPQDHATADVPTADDAEAARDAAYEDFLRRRHRKAE